MSTKIMDIDNSKLEEIMDVYAKEPNKDNLLKLVWAVKDTKLFVPAMAQPKNGGFQPYVVKNTEGSMYMPAFTSIAKFPENHKYQGMLKLQYKQCAAMLLDHPTLVEGIVLNPFTDNLMLKSQMLQLTRRVDEEQKEQQKKKGFQMKASDFHMVTRHSVEFHLIPEKLFQEKVSFLEQLDEEKLLEFYKTPYRDANQEAIFPYRKEDFEMMQLNIREDLNLIQIVAPRKNLVKTTCREIYIVWNPGTEKLAYYLIERGLDTQKEEYFLDQVREDGTWEKLEEAPEEGSAISRLMELFEQQ